MPLPPNVQVLLASESASAHTHHMFEVKTNIASANNLLRHVSVRMVDEPSAQQAMAIAKILKLPKS